MPSYKFDSSTVADKVTQLIDHAIGYKKKQDKSNKYFRGITGAVNGTVADVYLFGAAPPIKNVKIASGVKHLTAGEEVYINAIAGRLENSVIEKRVIDYNLLFEDDVDNYLTIDDFGKNFLDWTIFPETPPRTFIPDHLNFKLYTEARKVELYEAPISSTPIEISFGLEPPGGIDGYFDFTVLHDGDVSTEDDYIYMSLYISDATYYNYIKFNFFDNAPSYTYTINAPSIITGWNNLKMKKSDFTNYSNLMTGWGHITGLTMEISFNDVAVDDFITFAYFGIGKFNKPTVVQEIDTKLNTMTGATNQILVQDINNIKTVSLTNDFMKIYTSNIALGKATPSSWNETLAKAFDIGDTGSIFAYTDTNKNINLSQNVYYDNEVSPEFRRIETGKATSYYQSNGKHVFYYDDSDTAGTIVNLTQAFSIDDSENFHFGSHKFTVSATEPATPSNGDLWIKLP